MTSTPLPSSVTTHHRSRDIRLIDTLLDEWFRFQVTSRGGHTARTFTVQILDKLAARLGITVNSSLSDALQTYRRCQDPTYKYTIASESYGQSARWFVFAGPGLCDQIGEQLIIQHREWIVRDLQARALSDLEHELRPAVSVYPMIQAIVETHLAQALRSALDNTMAAVHALTEFYETTSGTSVSATVEAELMEMEALNASMP